MLQLSRTVFLLHLHNLDVLEYQHDMYANGHSTGSHYCDYNADTFAFLSNHCNSFEYMVQIDLIFLHLVIWFRVAFRSPYKDRQCEMSSNDKQTIPKLVILKEKSWFPRHYTTNWCEEVSTARTVLLENIASYLLRTCTAFTDAYLPFFMCYVYDLP